MKTFDDRFIVRTATPNDADDLVQLVNSAYRGDSSRKGWTTEADFLGGQRIDRDLAIELIRKPRKQVLLLIDRNEIVACVALEHFDYTDEDRKLDPSRRQGTYLGMLTVRPTLQTGGIGKRLMKEAESFARSSGSSHMNLGVIQLRVELMAWYERRGYVKNGQLLPFPYGDVRFGEPKRDDLHFVMFDKKL